MKKPKHVLDMHTHLFNSRYLPLASIIAHAMDRDESPLATALARLIVVLTGSSYKGAKRKKRSVNESDQSQEDFLLDELWGMTEYELIVATHSTEAKKIGKDILAGMTLADNAMQGLRETELLRIIRELAEIDYAAEGWSDTVPDIRSLVVGDEHLFYTVSLESLFDWAEKVVRFAFKAVNTLMDPEAWGKAENYLEFFLTMLKSERSTLRKLMRSYRKIGVPVRVVHMMMDMQKAYTGEKSPYYPFHPSQLDRMQELQRENPKKMIGFSAFDPRREDWEVKANQSLSMGFMGFKFYPAMGYKPVGNDDPLVQRRIDEFFSYCVGENEVQRARRDIPLFAHCTPVGFQTRERLGHYAHPKFWGEVLLQDRFSRLRLCLGHAGGGRDGNGSVYSAGWLARTDEEWNDPDNFARIVVELCATYENVFCDFGYILEIMNRTGRDMLVSNLERAQQVPGDYSFFDKAIYGSDWHMPSMVDNTYGYYKSWLKIMNLPQFSKRRDDFFWRNGYRFLKLRTP
jgi:hypothetical protein